MKTQLPSYKSTVAMMQEQDPAKMLEHARAAMPDRMVPSLEAYSAADQALQANYNDLLQKDALKELISQERAQARESIEALRKAYGRFNEHFRKLAGAQIQTHRPEWVGFDPGSELSLWVSSPRQVPADDLAQYSLQVLSEVHRTLAQRARGMMSAGASMVLPGDIQVDYSVPEGWAPPPILADSMTGASGVFECDQLLGAHTFVWNSNPQEAPLTIVPKAEPETVWCPTHDELNGICRIACQPRTIGRLEQAREFFQEYEQWRRELSAHAAFGNRELGTMQSHERAELAAMYEQLASVRALLDGALTQHYELLADFTQVLVWVQLQGSR